MWHNYGLKKHLPPKSPRPGIKRAKDLSTVCHLSIACLYRQVAPQQHSSHFQTISEQTDGSQLGVNSPSTHLHRDTILSSLKEHYRPGVVAQACSSSYWGG